MKRGYAGVAAQFFVGVVLFVLSLVPLTMAYYVLDDLGARAATGTAEYAAAALLFGVPGGVLSALGIALIYDAGRPGVTKA